jgi:hypothetical protein
MALPGLALSLKNIMGREATPSHLHLKFQVLLYSSALRAPFTHMASHVMLLEVNPIRAISTVESIKVGTHHTGSQVLRPRYDMDA